MLRITESEETRGKSGLVARRLKNGKFAVQEFTSPVEETQEVFMDADEINRLKAWCRARSYIIEESS